MTERTFMAREQRLFLGFFFIRKKTCERKRRKLKIIGKKLMYRSAPSSLGYLPKHGSLK
jgi:hypothetical protein